MQRYRSVFISDIHLGSAGCRTLEIVRFLKSFECDQLYLVGDIIDGWVGSRESKWTQAHNDVIRTLLGKAKHGTQLLYSPGNHDAFLRKQNGSDMGNITIEHSFEHLTADGRKLLVVHGDLYDRSVTKFQRVAYVGAWGYEYVTLLNAKVNRSRFRRDQRPVNFSAGLKRYVKRVVKGATGYEEALIADAREDGYQGVVCGHIHRPALETRPDGMIYLNTGDWVEHCTGAVELADGTLQLLDLAGESPVVLASSGGAPLVPTP